MIVVDTDVISEPLRTHPKESVVSWLDAQIIETLYLTTVTLAELRLGIAVLPRGRRRDRLALQVEDDLLPAFIGRILAFDEPASATYARLCARARAKGQPIGVADGYIAAIAADQASRSLPATRRRSPLPVFESSTRSKRTGRVDESVSPDGRSVGARRAIGVPEGTNPAGLHATAPDARTTVTCGDTLGGTSTDGRSRSSKLALPVRSRSPAPPWRPRKGGHPAR